VNLIFHAHPLHLRIRNRRRVDGFKGIEVEGNADSYVADDATKLGDDGVRPKVLQFDLFDGTNAGISSRRVSHLEENVRLCYGNQNEMR
jgi:hypothetical protein